MGARSSTHNQDPENLQRRAVEKQIALAEFGRRLQHYLLKAGLNQTEFARKAQAYLEGDDIKRDAVSNYVNGKYFPTPARLKAMADALGIHPQELLPARGLPEAGEALPPINVQDMQNGTAWLRINQAVSWPIAVKVLALLRGEGSNI